MNTHCTALDGLATVRISYHRFTDDTNADNRD
jgi:hypothetical protein